jgi:LysM repeat protein
MKFSAWLVRCALAVLLCAVANGCLPPSQSPMEDEKEPHFIEGKHAVNTYDFNGAIEEFEKAVEANPRNASAHFELGWLYEEKEPDPAAAIYHYQQFLKLRPTADTAEAVRQRITNCKIDLAKGVMPLPSSPGVQHDLEQLIQSNKQLQIEVDQWRAWYKSQTNRAQPQVSAPMNQPTQTTTQIAQPVEPVAVATQTVRTNPPALTPGATRFPTRVNSVRTTYIVQSRDTLASISRKFNVKLDSLIAANPGLDARRLRPGQTVNIP